MQAIADRLGGTDRMADFLRYLVQNYTFAPFTTMDFVAYLQEFSGVDLRAQFLDWVFNGREPSVPTSGTAGARAEQKALDLDPPWGRRHGESAGGR
jgi:aminopeptidase N